MKNNIRLDINSVKKLQYHFAQLTKFLLILPLTGCFCMQKMEVLPKSLPNAKVGNPYYAKIEVWGGKVIDYSFYYDIKPENSGLELSIPSYFESHVSYNDLEVKGIPKAAGAINIELIGDTYGTMTCVGRDFKKVYNIKVEE